MVTLGSFSSSVIIFFPELSSDTIILILTIELIRLIILIITMKRIPSFAKRKMVLMVFLSTLALVFTFIYSYTLWFGHCESRLGFSVGKNLGLF